MNLTEALKKHLQTAFGVAADADDATYRKVLGEKLASGDMDWKKLEELTKAPEQKDAKTLISSMIQEQMAPVTKLLEQLVQKQTVPVTPAPVAPAPEPVKALSADDVAKIANEAVTKRMAETVVPTPNQIYGANARLYDGVRVKGVYERYDCGRKSLAYGSDSKHVELRGQPVNFLSKQLNVLSQADYATIGAFAKWQAMCCGRRDGFAVTMNEDDVELVKRALEEEQWTGMLGGEDYGEPINGKKLTQKQTSTLMNDTDSGGSTAIPVIFEEAIMQTPLLYGELFPLVNLRTITSGTTVRTHNMAYPTFTSGVEENTAISLIDISGFITAINTTVYTAVSASQIGLDFDQDSLPDFGKQLTMGFGDKAKEWLDEQIALGDGTTEPQGIFNASGTVTVNARNAGGSVCMQDAEALFFGVNKAFQNSRGGGRNVYVGNEVNYQRLKTIPSWAGANLRADNSPYNSYTIKGAPYKISTAIGNAKLAFVNLAWYTMVRRLGASLRIETAGKTLALSNLKLFVVRMRYGGQLHKGGACAVMTDLPA